MTQVKKTTTSKREVYAKNPFLTFTVTATKKKMTVSKGSVITGTTEDGENVSVETTIAQAKLVDSDSFIKLFTGQVSAIFDLSSSGIKLFTVLLQEAQKGIGGDMVFLNPSIVSDLAKANGKSISAPTYHRGINDLIAAKIIAPASLATGWFYINPAIIFNGDRARFVTEYYTPKKEKIANKNQQQLRFGVESHDQQQEEF